METIITPKTIPITLSNLTSPIPIAFLFINRQTTPMSKNANPAINISIRINRADISFAVKIVNSTTITLIPSKVINARFGIM